MGWTKRTTPAGELVRAGLDWGRPEQTGLSFEQLCNCPGVSVRILSEIPNLVIPCPPGVPWDADQEARAAQVNLAWAAAGKARGVAGPARAKALDKKYWDSMDLSLEILSGHRIDVWTWSLYAQLTQVGKYAASKHVWFGPTRTREHSVGDISAYKPPPRGWITPTEQQQDLVKLRGLITSMAMQCGVEAADQVCTEKAFQDKLDLLIVDNNNRLTQHEKAVQQGLWKWPTLRALGHREL